jgi:plasmid stability protein
MHSTENPDRRTSLFIRNLDPALMRALRQSASTSGVSTEEEARRILARALVDFVDSEVGVEASLPVSLGAAMEKLFGSEGGVELSIPPREMGRPPPDFSEAGEA